MKLSYKPRTKIISCIFVFLSVSFLLGELFGLYAIRQLSHNLDTIMGNFYTNQSIIGKFGKTLLFYLPCLFQLVHHRWFILVPAALFYRGYVFSCSLAAMSYLNGEALGNLFSLIISAGAHTMSLTVLSSYLIYYLLVKQKYVFGNIAVERKLLFRSVCVAIFLFFVCMISELLIHN